MTVECVDKNILSLRCKAAELASKWQDKVKTGKWCDEQECALILSDWGLDILCRYKKALEETPSQNSIFICSGAYFCFTEEEICKIINNLHRVLTFKCNCC